MLKPLLLSLLIAAAPSFAVVPPTSAPATSPTTQPIELAGYVAPRDAQEVKPQLKRFTTPLTVTEVVAHGANVRTGQPLIRFGLKDLEAEILEATSGVDVARANLAKAESDNAVGQRADAAMLEERTDAVADAERNFAWWRDIEAPDFLARLDEAVKSAADSVEDQTDELDQLKKMYKSEELTNATADIVVKRAVRSLERAKKQLELARHDADQKKATAYQDKKREFDRLLLAAKRGLDEANAQIAQSKVTRAAAVLKARGELRDAQQKLNELEQDKAALDIKATADGVAFYGTLVDGVWQRASSDAIKVGEKLDVAKGAMTVLRSESVRVIAKVEEGSLFRAREGATVEVRPAALPEVKLQGLLGKAEPLPAADGTFEVMIELHTTDVRLLPGMKVKVELDAAK